MCDNIGIVTAYANDISYEKVFSEQLKSLASAGDLLITISGSGDSKNILNAIETAKDMKLKTLGLLGFGGGKASKMVDCSVVVDSKDMQLCEDFHLMFGHMVMKKLCGIEVISN